MRLLPGLRRLRYCLPGLSRCHSTWKLTMSPCHRAMVLPCHHANHMLCLGNLPRHNVENGRVRYNLPVDWRVKGQTQHGGGDGRWSRARKPSTSRGRAQRLHDGCPSSGCDRRCPGRRGGRRRGDDSLAGLIDLPGGFDAAPALAYPSPVSSSIGQFRDSTCTSSLQVVRIFANTFSLRRSPSCSCREQFPLTRRLRRMRSRVCWGRSGRWRTRR